MEYIPCKTIVTKTKSTGWFGTDYNMNIYKGCNHGCIYCDSRSDCYGVEDFDRVRVKENALAVIRDDLKRKVKKGVIGTGAMSDPYNPFEKELLLTRNALELISAYGFGMAIDTKSTLIQRDIDVLKEIKEEAPVIIKITITTADDTLCRKIEPGAPSSEERFQAIRQLSDNGIFTGIIMTPILPFINDKKENILSIVELGLESGARFIYPTFGVTLRSNQRAYYYEKLDLLFPGLKEKYIKRYSGSYSCGSPHSKELWEVFTKECEKTGLLYKMTDIIRAYKLGYNDRQLSLFDML